MQDTLIMLTSQGNPTETHTLGWSLRWSLIEKLSAEVDWDTAQCQCLCLWVRTMASRVGSGQDMKCVCVEWVWLNNAYTVHQEEVSNDCESKKRSWNIVAQRSVCGCESIQPTVSSLQAGPQQKQGLNMAKVKGQSCAVVGAKEGLGLELKMDLRDSQVSTFCGWMWTEGVFSKIEQMSRQGNNCLVPSPAITAEDHLPSLCDSHLNVSSEWA